MTSEVPLCVSMELALLRTNVSVESFLQRVKRNGLYALCAARWLLPGRTRWQLDLVRRSSLDSTLWPVNEDLLARLGLERQRGRSLVLCASSPRELAEKVAARVGLFDEVVTCNDAAATSVPSIESMLEERFGSFGYQYMATAAEGSRLLDSGDSRRSWKGVDAVDLPRKSSVAGKLALWVRALRLHQWAKNLLIFVAAIASHQLLKAGAFLAVIEAFVWFGLCASGTYIVNDLLDLEADRAHLRKRHRPFASGDLPLSQGIVMALVLLGVAIGGALRTLGLPFVCALIFYLASTLWYSFVLKRIAMVDVLALAGLYTVRVIAGGIAIAVTPSFWLLAFSMFLFFSLAMIKRYTELNAVLAEGRSVAPGRGYVTDDLPLLLSCGVAAGFLSVLVLALYVDLGANGLYRIPQAIWLLCPILLYWVSRMWRKAHRGELHDDPIVFAISDRPSLIVLGICAVLVWLAS